jgi:hypothetical protein
MRLPELTDSGDLPLGVHRASLRETLERFAVGHPRRIAVGDGSNESTALPRQLGTWFVSLSLDPSRRTSLPPTTWTCS